MLVKATYCVISLETEVDISVVLALSQSVHCLLSMCQNHDLKLLQTTAGHQDIMLITHQLSWHSM